MLESTEIIDNGLMVNDVSILLQKRYNVPRLSSYSMAIFMIAMLQCKTRTRKTGTSGHHLASVLNVPMPTLYSVASKLRALSLIETHKDPDLQNTNRYSLTSRGISLLKIQYDQL
jgi:hypothetical protein